MHRAARNRWVDLLYKPMCLDGGNKSAQVPLLPGGIRFCTSVCSSSFALASSVSATRRSSACASRLYISSARCRACAARDRNSAAVSTCTVDAPNQQGPGTRNTAQQRWKMDRPSGSQEVPANIRWTPTANEPVPAKTQQKARPLTMTVAVSPPAPSMAAAILGPGPSRLKAD